MRRRPLKPESAPVELKAISDLEVRSLPSTSGTSSDLTVGGRGAGYKFTDLCYGTEILRVTDDTIIDDITNESYNLSSAANHMIWSCDSRYFYVSAQFGGCYPFSFNPVTFVATRLNETANTPSDGTYMQVPFKFEPVFSRATPGLLYGAYNGGGFDNHTIRSYNFLTDAFTTLLDLDDLGFDLTNSTPNKTGDNIGYISVSDKYQGGKERICVLFGGNQQDWHYLIVVFDKDNPTDTRVLDTRNLRVGVNSGSMSGFTNADMNSTITGTVTASSGGNTLTGSGTNFTNQIAVGSDIIVGGEQKTVTAIASNTSLTISGTWASNHSGVICKTEGFGIHNAEIDKSGRYVLVYRGVPAPPGVSIVFVWDTQTDAIAYLTYRPLGHAEPGYGEWFNVTDDGSPGGPYGFFLRPLDDVNNSSKVKRLVGSATGYPTAFDVGDHSTWNTQNVVNQRTPIIDSTYLLLAGYSRGRQAWDDEITAIETAAAADQNRVWRLVHHRSDIRGDAGAQFQFDYTPRANVSPCGRFVLFCSNWDKTLGNRFNGSGDATKRVDIFMLRVPTEPPLVANVQSSPTPTATSITSSGATITATLDNAGDFCVHYAADPTTPTASSPKFTNYVLASGSRSVALTGLTAGTTYNLLIRSRNRAGVGGGTQTLQFATTGGASDFLNDTFTESSDTALASHVGETGATWSIGSGQSAGATVDAASDRVFFTATTNYYASGTPPSADYFVEGVFHVHSIVDTQTIGITLRHATDANTFYGVRYNESTGQLKWQLFKRVAGTFTELGSGFAQTLTPGNSYTAKLVISGSNLEVFIDGVSRITATDSAITAAGKAGMEGRGAASTSTTGIHISSIRAQ